MLTLDITHELVNFNWLRIRKFCENCNNAISETKLFNKSRFFIDIDSYLSKMFAIYYLQTGKLLNCPYS